MKLVKKFMNYQLIILVAVSIIPLTQSPLNAQEKNNSSANNRFSVSFEPPNKNQPVATSGGASRGQQCIADMNNSEIPITAIVPAINQRLTVASHPTFFIHVPETSAQKVFLNIQDENEEDSYQKVIPIDGKSGIIGVTLPQDAPPLKIGKNYQWSLALICQESLKPDSPIVQGTVTRVQSQMQLAEISEEMTKLEQAALYAEAGIWYETIATLAQLKQEQPNNSNLLSVWEEVLTSVGLGELAQAEFVK